jgi:hypothetical protein
MIDSVGSIFKSLLAYLLLLIIFITKIVFLVVLYLALIILCFASLPILLPLYILGVVGKPKNH